MVAVAYRRWSFTRCFNGKALTGQILVFSIGGRLWEVVTYERWSHMEVHGGSRMYVVSIWAMLRHIDIKEEQNKHLLESMQHVLAHFQLTILGCC